MLHMGMGERDDRIDEGSLAEPLLVNNQNNHEPLLTTNDSEREVSRRVKSAHRPVFPPSSSANNINNCSSTSPTASRRRRPSSSLSLSTQSLNSGSGDREPLNASSRPSFLRYGRILDRDAAYYQSRGRWRIQHIRKESTRYYSHSGRRRRCNRNEEDELVDGMEEDSPPIRMALSKQFWDEWFHVLAYQRTWKLMLILFGVYALIVVHFAVLYYGLSKYGQERKTNEDGSISILPSCDMDIHTHMEALYFSLSTMTTIGYGVSDYYFGGCLSPLILVLMEVCAGIIFTAVATSLLFLRVSRGHKRSKTILFSDKAVIRCVRGVPYLLFRVVELRRSQLVGARIQAYCIRHERHATITRDDPVHTLDATATSTSTATAVDSSSEASPPLHGQTIETIHFVTRPMSLSSGDCESGAGMGSNGSSPSPVSLLMSLPQVLMHKMDASSPLVPSSTWYDVRGRAHSPLNNNINNNSDSNDDNSLEDLRRFLTDRDTEIVVLVEGTDELTGAATQTRHSYSLLDLKWNHTFVPCVYPALEFNQQQQEVEDVDPDHPNTTRLWGGGCRTRRANRSSLNARDHISQRQLTSASSVCVVDFSCFHDTSPAPSDCDTCPYVLE